MKLQKRALDTLRPYENNPRRNDGAVDAVAESIRQCSYISPIVVDEDGVILAGHTRFKALEKLGYEDADVLVCEGLTEEQKRKFRVLDNRAGEIAEWDMEKLAVELDALDFGEFDFGFDAEAPETVHVREHERRKDGHFWGDAEGEGNEEYDAFVEKFKPKLTTDDCYTPQNIYEAVRDWAVEHYGLQGAPVVRPFYPGGDYEREAYPDGCVVIDNPPFSILSQICRFYMARGIRFFLFAPSLTLFSTNAGKCNYLPVGAKVTYENGAEVSTSFVTNCGEWKIETAPELRARIEALDDENRAERRTELPGYTYPDCVITSKRIVPTAKWSALRIPASDARFVRALDEQRAQGKAIYGGGFLLSEKAAAEKAAAEKTAAEKAAAEKAARHVWVLSEREKAIVAALGTD